MDRNRMYSKTGVGNMMSVELPLHTTPQQPQLQLQPQNSQHHFQNHPKIMAFPRQHQQQHEQQQTNLSMKQPISYLSYINPAQNPSPNPTQNPFPSLKSKTQVTNSEEDELNSGNDQENSSLDGSNKRKGGGSSSNNNNNNMVSSSSSPWQRMKWTDNMVRLLIMAVYYIGDEAGNNEVNSDKKKSGGGLQQKKGKWKSVSRAMMEKGFFVSPQQCEDKFNDLNKRYKRVNDILGRGVACKVVENQTLLDSMEIAPKLKEEVRKLLNSKHLFFKEMCAYHNSCGHGGGGGGGSGSHLGDAAAVVGTVGSTLGGSDGLQMQPQSHFHPQQNLCLQHSSLIPTMTMSRGSEEEEEGDYADDEDDGEEEEDDDEEEDDGGGGARKRARIDRGISSNTTQALQKLKGEIMGVLQNGSKNSWEKQQWMTTQLVQLEEEGVKFQSRALELEKQRLKWLKFSSKKEREMEQMKLDNERQRLENERKMLLLRQKEIELLLHTQKQQHHTSTSTNTNPSCVGA